MLHLPGLMRAYVVLLYCSAGSRLNEADRGQKKSAMLGEHSIMYIKQIDTRRNASISLGTSL
jgi:hypothetical protein